MREHGSREIQRGSPLRTTYQGSHEDKVTLAQLPPAAGDSWSVDCSLRCGVYLLILDGWENAAHGIPDLWLDGRRVGEAGIDWCGERTVESSRSIIVSVRWTGVHQLAASCSRTSADEARPTRSTCGEWGRRGGGSAI